MLKVLNILSKGESKYKIMFKETRVSHITLQEVLKYLAKKKFILRNEIGYKDVDYKITDEGKKFFKKLEELKEILE